MSDHIAKTIADLKRHIEDLLQVVHQKKVAVNAICTSFGLPLEFEDLGEGPGKPAKAKSSGPIYRSDELFNKPFAAVVRIVLEKRREAGLEPPTAEEILADLKSGGFAIEAKDQLQALRISITKNSSTFVKLPNDRFGLPAWYNMKPRTKSEPGATATAPLAEDMTQAVSDDEEKPEVTPA